ncbi:hypothetical protein FB451DRAFT_1173370 [Mycena latifolia]|nr:hypothetical protein FB451DRAFT_1173370 [Mycena latifolia]
MDGSGDYRGPKLSLRGQEQSKNIFRPAPEFFHNELKAARRVLRTMPTASISPHHLSQCRTRVHLAIPHELPLPIPNIDSHSSDWDPMVSDEEPDPMDVDSESEDSNSFDEFQDLEVPISLDEMKEKLDEMIGPDEEAILWDENKIDFKTLPDRILGFKEQLLEMIQDRNILENSLAWKCFLDNIDSRIFEFSASHSKLEFTALCGRRCGYCLAQAHAQLRPQRGVLINSTILRALSQNEESLGYTLFDTLQSIIDDIDPAHLDEYDPRKINTSIWKKLLKNTIRAILLVILPSRHRKDANTLERAASRNEGMDDDDIKPARPKPKPKATPTSMLILSLQPTLKPKKPSKKDKTTVAENQANIMEQKNVRTAGAVQSFYSTRSKTTVTPGTDANCTEA